MRFIAVLAATLLSLSLPAFSQTMEANPKRFSDSCAYTKSCVYEPYGEIEKKYYADGPWKDVIVRETDVPCDSLGNKCVLFYPTNLSLNGFKHPIVAYGNGTNGKPSEAAYFLKHLASWGFVVIGSGNPQTIEGITILDSVKFLIGANSDPRSVFHEKLDVAQIGATGYSQGGLGVISAMIKSGGLIKTVIPIEPPAMWVCTAHCDEPDVRRLTQGSIFFVDGSNDPISPPTQLPGWSGEQSIEAYYNDVPSSVLKLKGTLIGPSHNDITGQPGCATAAGWACIVGVYGYLGYPTAWFMYQLQGDQYARGAFLQDTGEMFRGPTQPALRNWEYVASNIR